MLKQVIPFFCFVFSVATLGATQLSDLTITSAFYNSLNFKPTLPVFLNGADPYAINNSGVVLGDYFYRLGQNYESGGFTYTNGTLTRFDYPAVRYYILPAAINDNGTIILSSPQSDVGFVGTPGAFTPLTFPGATQTSLYGLNNAGVIVGSYLDASSVQHGFIYRPGGTYTSFDAPLAGASSTELTGINNLGDIVGTSNAGSFSIVNGTFQTLFGPRPTSINDNDQILFPNGYHGIDILHYKTNTLEVLTVTGGGYLQEYQARLNNSGVITGGNSGFILLPAPEPATLLLTLPALAGIAFFAKRRRGRNSLSE